MENIFNENIQAARAVLNEGKITPLSLAEEFKPLFDDYFVCKTDICTGGWKIDFSRGKKFLPPAGKESRKSKKIQKTPPHGEPTVRRLFAMRSWQN